MINRVRGMLKNIFEHLLQILDDVSLYCEEKRIF